MHRALLLNYLVIHITFAVSINSVPQINQISKKYIWEPLVHRLRKSFWFQRNNGRDHIFLFADGQGPRIWDSYDFFRSTAVFLSPEATCPTWGESVRSLLDVKLCLSPWKDIVIPGHTDFARLEYMKQVRKDPGGVTIGGVITNGEDRPLLATFHGRIPGKHVAYSDCAIRGNLVKSLQGLPGIDIGGFVGNYLELKGAAHFCLVPAGTSPWTNHLYESLYAGCVPVILSDEYSVAYINTILIFLLLGK